MVEYSIPFKGMKDGKHHFSFELDKGLLEHFPFDGLLDFKVHTEVEMIKQNRLLEFGFTLDGEAQAECDRCLDPVTLEIAFENKLFVKIGDQRDDEGEIIYLGPEDNEINLARYLFENIIFALPLKIVHPDKKGKNSCNAEMLKKLKKYSVSSDEPAGGGNTIEDLLN